MNNREKTDEELTEALESICVSIAGKNDKAFFLNEQIDFLENHFYWLFSLFEGNACCADKARTVIYHIKLFFENGKQISFDFEQKYTYHLPKKIFKTHYSIMEAYDALERLYNGNPLKYFKVLKDLYENAEDSK